MRASHRYPEGRICGTVAIGCSMQRCVPQPRDHETPLRQSTIRLAARYGRYGNRQITGLLWLAYGLCVRLRLARRIRSDKDPEMVATKRLLETSTDVGRDKYHQGRGVPNLMQMLLRA